MMSGAAASEDLPRGEGNQLLRARADANKRARDRAGIGPTIGGLAARFGSAFAGPKPPPAGALAAGAELPASAGAVAAGGASAGSAGAVPVSRSIAERIGSRGLRLRTASKIGCAAPDRWMRL